MSVKVLVTATVQSHICQFHKPLAEYLHEHKCEVHVAANNNLNLKPGLELNFVDKVYDVPFSRSPKSKSNIKAYKILRNIIDRNKYDLIICNTPMGGVITRLAAKKARKMGTKVYYIAHGFHFFRGASKLNWSVFYPIEKYLADRITDKIITINTEDYQLAKDKFKTEVQYMHGVGVDFNAFYDTPSMKVISDKYDEIGLPQNSKIVLSVGELNDNKNHATSIRAFSKIKDDNSYYCICGNGPNLEQLKQLSIDLGVAERIRFLGYRRDIPILMHMSSVYLFPSYREGLSVSIMEAMASGLPVICSEIRGNCDLIDKNQGGYLVNPNDIDAFTKYLALLLDDDEMRLNMGRYNANKVVSFSLDSVKKDFSDIYGKIIGE